MDEVPSSRPDEEPPSETEARVPLPHLSAAARGATLAVLGVLLLAAAVFSGDLLARGVGVALVLTGLVDTVRTARRAGSHWQWVRPLLLVAIGGWLLVASETSVVTIGILVGIAIGGAGATEALYALLDRRGDWQLGVVTGTIGVVVGAIVVLWPSAAIHTAIAVAGVVALVVGAGSFVVARRVRGADELSVWSAFVVWLKSHQYEPEERRVLVDRLFLLGHRPESRLTRFVVLTAMAGAIAALGIARDSVAIVIGAMIIAPIMTPIMGVAAGLIMGWPRRAVRSALVLVLSSFGVVLIGAAVGFALPGFLLERNALLETFATPTLLDLAVALVAGAAGGFAVARKDVAESLPGVAVAVSLVPALAAAGLLFQVGQPVAGRGALLMYLMNAIAIVVAGVVAFVFTGFAPIRRIQDARRSVRIGVALALLALLVLIIPLGRAVDALIARADLTGTVRSDTVAWLEAHPGYELVDVSLAGDIVEVRIAGDGPPPPVRELENRVAVDLGGEVHLVVKALAQQTLTTGTG